MASNQTPIAMAFAATLELFQTGIDVMRQNIRRHHPNAADEEIERRLHDWLIHRPGAEFGDCPGRSLDVKARLGS
jgi:Rv0078B-related antitoxin